MRLHHRFDGDEQRSGARALGLARRRRSSSGTQRRRADVAVPILRYDHRGHGRSPVPTGPYTVEELAEDALELLDELGLERVSFCGLSLGGAVGMALALRRPGAARAPGPLLHVGPVRAAREVGRARADRSCRRPRAARRGDARALVHARVPCRAAGGRRTLPRPAPRDPERGLCRLLRGSRGLGRARAPRPDRASRRS